MTYWPTILGIFGLLAVLGWCFAWIRAWLHSRQYLDIPAGSSATLSTGAPFPSLSVLVPACNEEQNIEAAAVSLLQQSYPNLELIFINDRSTDGTGEIIGRLAEQNDRITAIHIETLPDGWLGKVHALHVATEQASGDWLLYTDADVEFAENALIDIVHFAESAGVDHLAGLPRMRPAGHWIGLAIAAFYTSAMFFVSAKRVSNTDDPLAVGVGAMNLVRKSKLQQSEGFQWLKMETIDDMGLGLLMKRAGGRAAVARAGEQVSLQWYQNLAEMAKGLEKNSPGLTQYRVLRSIGLLGILPAVLFGFICTLFLPIPIVAAIWGVSVAFPLIAMSTFARQTALAKNSFFLLPIGLLLLWVIFVRALILLWFRGGVCWRGTSYDVGDLRCGQRIDF